MAGKQRVPHNFPGAILRNKFIDHLRREKKLARKEDDSDETRPQTTIPRSRDDDIVARELTERLLDLVNGHKNEQELRDFIHAGSMISETGKVNQQIADLLEVDEGEVVNRRKMLWRVAGVTELYEEFRYGRKRDQSAS
jgi:hypothetical protein